MRSRVGAVGYLDLGILDLHIRMCSRVLYLSCALDYSMDSESDDEYSYTILWPPSI